LIEAETGIKTIAAVHSQCRCWVKSGQTIAGQNQDLSVVGPIATKLLQRSERSDVPLATDAPQQTAHTERPPTAAVSPKSDQVF
jgi:hypothetical protein